MKKYTKNLVFVLLFCALLILPVTRVGAAKLCPDYEPNECPVSGGFDQDGNRCTTKYEGSKFICTYAPDDEQECYAFNAPRYYGSNGMPDSSKCPSDRCTTDRIEGYCLPKISSDSAYTCEDYGYHTNVYGTGDLCTTDGWGNQCAGDENDRCYTYEVLNTDEKTCKEYSETYCKLYRKDDYGNECDWDYTKKECIVAVSQFEINDFATGSTQQGIGYSSGEELQAVYTLSVIGKEGFNPMDRDIEEKKEIFKCSDVKYLTSAWLFIRIAAPFLIILFGSLDFFKAMIANDEKKMKESRGKFVKRLIAFGLLVVLPFVVQFIFTTAGTYGSERICLVKCIVTNDTSDKGCD